MIEKLDHYSLTNPASVYDEEAMTALELAGRTAGKVNEAIDLVNENEQTVKDAKEYMVDNLEDTVKAEVNKLKNDGTLATELVKAVSSGKVDKGGKGQVSYAMLAQDAREAMTGGSVAVVGPNAVLEGNIVDGAVTEVKLQAGNRRVLYRASDMDTPVLILDRDSKTGQINPALTENITLYTNDNSWTIDPTTITVDDSEYDGSNYLRLFYSPSLKILKVTPLSKSGVSVGDYLDLGRMAWTVADNAIPVQIADRYFCARTQTRLVDSARGLKPVRIGMDRFRHRGNAIFNVDTVNKTITIVKGGKYNCYAMNESPSVNFVDENLVYDTVDFSKGVMYMWFDSVTGKIHFMNNITDNPRWWHYFGVVHYTKPYYSSCVVPFSVDGKYYYHPGRNRREWATVVYSPYSYATRTLPYVDFAKKQLVFPSVNRLYILTNEMTMSIMQSTGEDYVVPFDSTDNPYQYLVGGPYGLKFIPPEGLTDLNASTDQDELYILGHCVQTNKTINFNFDCEKGRSVSILGDSISTFEGYIPSGNRAYYNEAGGADVNMTWWKRTMNRCGLSLNVNNSYSGSRVSNTRDDGQDWGIEMAKHLDNGTAPDVILIYMGINDYISKVPMGEYNGRGPIPTTDQTFRESYAQMLHNVLTTYPTAKVYACTLPPVERSTGDTSNPDKNGIGIYLTEFNEAIRELCRAFCVEVIELESCGLHQHNGSIYMHDFDEETGGFVHPNSEGHRLISHKVIKSLVNSAE